MSNAFAGTTAAMSAKNEYPTQVCLDCGKTANHMHRIKQYGAMAIVPMNQGAFGAWQGICDVCGQDKMLTSPRDFFYPDIRAFDYLRNYLTRGRL